MDRRNFLRLGFTLFAGSAAGMAGCRGYQTARVMKSGERDMVGSHTAGAETYKPLIQESVSKLLGRACQPSEIQTAGLVVGARKKICFIGVENCTAEEIGDFRDQIYELIDSAVNESQQYEQLSRRYVENGLKQLRLRPDELFVQENQKNFQAVLEKMEQPFDYLLYARLTSGTTQKNGDYQRDYLLTLELVNIHDGHYEKESASIRKGYRRSLKYKIFH